MGTTHSGHAGGSALLADVQHEKSVGLIDELRLMILERGDALAVEEVLEGLASFAGCEFAEQEALMRSSGAPDWQAHKRRHDEMASRLGSLQRRFAYERDAVGREELYECLSDWLGHVLRED
jgi:hemerythrin-like metal-binding protein